MMAASCRSIVRLIIVTIPVLRRISALAISHLHDHFSPVTGKATISREFINFFEQSLNIRTIFDTFCSVTFYQLYILYFRSNSNVKWRHLKMRGLITSGDEKQNCKNI